CETSRRVATSSTVSPSGSHTNACARCSALGSWVVWATSTSLWYSVDERRRSIDFSPFHSGDSMLHHIYDRTFCNLLRCRDPAIGGIGNFGKPHPFLCKNSPIGEGAALDKTGSKV